MPLFAALREIRGFERTKLPFLKALIDFDIVVEIGYAQEQEKPLTPKQLFLLDLSSLTTVRRRLAKLVEQGVVTRRPSTKDRRSASLRVSPRSLKLLDRYGSALTTICATI